MSAPSSTLTAGIGAIEHLLLGSVATSIAILTVAAVGFLMLYGRIQPRRAATTIIGCFILFSAAAIANGLLEAITAKPVQLADAAPSPDYSPSAPKPMSSDPYAGASVPDQRTRDLYQ